ncbi:hypothetical protein NDU88_002977 [Pleurodeles waltl]|uniref:Uncharacterized protein n=1 Tax=Pleurodeles waltl TaxID=8319 RepID=A0AAV7TMS4_PLEWA|nr:hypothetical protein NDU88_002977 [Pleurodeles waltl]
MNSPGVSCYRKVFKRCRDIRSVFDDLLERRCFAVERRKHLNLEPTSAPQLHNIRFQRGSTIRLARSFSREPQVSAPRKVLAHSHAAQVSPLAAARRSGSKEPAGKCKPSSSHCISQLQRLSFHSIPFQRGLTTRLATPFACKPKVSAPRKAPHALATPANALHDPYSASLVGHLWGASAVCPVSQRRQTGYVYGPEAEPEFKRQPWPPS